MDKNAKIGIVVGFIIGCLVNEKLNNYITKERLAIKQREIIRRNYRDYNNFYR